MEFQEAVKQLLSNGYTPEKLAVECMTTAPTIKNWARGFSKPNKLVQIKVQEMVKPKKAHK